MMRWLDTKMKPPPRQHRKGPHPLPSPEGSGSEVTDDPLAALQIGSGSERHRQQQVYAVSRINPLYELEDHHQSSLTTISNRIKTNTKNKSKSHESESNAVNKPGSSGYGSSSHNETGTFVDHLKVLEDTTLFEQNPAFVKSIRVAGRGIRSCSKSTSQNSSSGTLTTIPEGKVDPLIPQPIWPILDDRCKHYDSLVDDALLLYTSLSYVPTNSDKEKSKCLESYVDLSVKDLLLELITNINHMIENKTNNDRNPEDMLKVANEKMKAKLETLKNSTEEEMKKLCVNLSNCKKMNCVLRALSNSSSGNSSQSSSGRARTSSSETEDIYQIPSGSSSSGFSDHPGANVLPIFVHEDLMNVPNGMRNALIYGTLCRVKNQNNSNNMNSVKHNNLLTSDRLNGNSDDKVLLSDKTGRKTLPKKTSLLKAVNDSKPSVWEQYYGVKAVPDGATKTVGKPTDVPIYPGGRPEADFTLDVPRSELLSKRLKEDKKWRCRCRLLTSFLGLVFFLLSVMAVSLMLTRGQRMFGSMV